jgi:hypothetical protein
MQMKLFPIHQRELYQLVKNKTFEELLLVQVKQMPNVKTGRKRIYGGAEVITSGEVSERMKKL